MKRLLILYCLIITSVFTIFGFVFAENPNEYVYALMYLPLVLFFSRRLITPYLNPMTSSQGIIPHSSELINVVHADKPKKKKFKPAISKTRSEAAEEGVIDPEILTDEEITDINKRLFLKLIGSAGLGLFIFSLFSKQSHAAFFGSMPGPGVISIKDSSGNVIDPKEKDPTDGYEVSDVDDLTIPAYYGFTDRDGNWYITREDSSGSFRYIRGASSYSTNWTNRVSQAYDYFDATF